MADAPPPGPPPPKVPEGWKAVWNAQYSEWFYVNTHTKASTWDRPTAPAPRPDADGAPHGPPPGYTAAGPGATATTINEKANPNNPYASVDVSSDAAYAARLQAEEDARARGAAPVGAADGYYGSSSYGQQQQQAVQGGQSRGLMGKLMGKLGGAGSRPPQQGGAGYVPQGYGGQQPGYGPPPPQGHYGAYGGYPPPQQAYYGQPQAPARSGGLGVAGGAALGLGGGLIGGMLLENAIEDHDRDEYMAGEQQGYDQGYDDGNDGGGDYGDF